MSTYEPGMDPRSNEAIEWALWCCLMCDCDKCRTVLDLPHWSDPPWSEDVSAWAKESAPTVRAKGWIAADDGFNLLCPNCRYK